MRAIRLFLLFVLATPLFAGVTDNVQRIPLQQVPASSAGAKVIPESPIPPVAPTPTPTPATCPAAVVANYSPGGAPAEAAMTTVNIEAVQAAAASGGCTSFVYSCPATYSLGIFCATPTVESIAYWQATDGSGPASGTTFANSYVAGLPDYTGSVAATGAELSACIQQIVSASFYPGVCPTP